MKVAKHHLLLVGLFFNCVLLACISGQNNVYKFVPKNSYLTKSIIRDAEQFYPVGDNLIIMYNISHTESYNSHLLFYNKNLQLISACYFPSERIDSIKNYTIFASLNEWRKGRMNSFINELPPPYKLSYTLIPNGSGIVISKVVDSINIDSSTVMFKVRSTTDFGNQWNNSKKDTSILSSFKKRGIIQDELHEYTFRHKGGTVEKRMFNAYHQSVWDKMIVPDERIWLSFYDQLWKHLTRRQHHRSR